MAGSLNRATLIGNLGNDPEIRNLPSGGKVANMSIATSETWRDKNTGERKEKTEWHRITVFSEGLVKVVEQYLRKGMTVMIEGSIQTRKWQDQAGNDKYSTEIVLQGFDAKLLMLGKKDGDGSGERQDRQPDQRKQNSAPKQNWDANLPDDDSDIPF